MMFSNPLLAVVLGALFGGFFVSGGDERKQTRVDEENTPHEHSQKI